MERKKRFILILILGLLSALGPFSIDMYLPAFPAIAAGLKTTVDTMSYSLASFFIGICLGQLLCGPLLDRFGRKIPICVGLILYILASIGAAMSSSLEMLIVLRFFQALGGCVGIVAPRAIVRDKFPVEESAKIFSLLILVLGISPLLAPTVGSYVLAVLGWQYVFIVLAFIAVLMFILVIFWLPESRQPDPNFSLKPLPIVRTFRSVLKEPQFYTYALAGGVSSAGLFAYLSGSPFVFMKLYGVTGHQYGQIFALIAAGLIGSSQLNNFFLKKYSSKQLMTTLMIFQAVIGGTLAMGTVTGFLGLYGTIFLIFLFLGCQGFIFPNSAALSMAPFAKEAGTASALMGALQMAMGAVSSSIVGFLNTRTAIPMAAVMAACPLIGIAILTLGNRKVYLSALTAK
jgi:MFS transporter, DHA1 family, multidrug resistance protein